MGSLFEIRNNFYLGNFQATINDAQRFSVDSLEKDILLYRSYIALKKYNLVLSEIDSSKPVELQAVRQLAEYLAANTEKKQAIVEELKKKNFSSTDDSTLPLMAAIIFFFDNDYDNTLRVLHGNNDLECLALQMQAQCSINRFDLASDTVKKMIEIDEDSTLTQLCQASLNLVLCDDKIQEAYYIYQELIDKYQATPLLSNGLAAAMFCSNRVPDTESILQQSLDKNADQPETLFNLMYLANYQGKSSENVQRYMNQLKDIVPNHSAFSDLKAKSDYFDDCVKMYKESNFE